MTAVFDVLSAIGDAIVGVIDFIVSFFMDIVYIVQLLASVLLQIPSFFSAWLPPELAALLVITITVAAIYKIAGRD